MSAAMRCSSASRPRMRRCSPVLPPAVSWRHCTSASMPKHPDTMRSICSMDSRATERRLALSVFAILAVVFVVWPEIDLAVAARFHANDWAWLFPRDSLLITWPYQAVPVLGRLLIGLLLAMLVA